MNRNGKMEPEHFTTENTVHLDAQQLGVLIHLSQLLQEHPGTREQATENEQELYAIVAQRAAQ